MTKKISIMDLMLFVLFISIIFTSWVVISRVIYLSYIFSFLVIYFLFINIFLTRKLYFNIIDKVTFFFLLITVFILIIHSSENSFNRNLRLFFILTIPVLIYFFTQTCLKYDKFKSYIFIFTISFSIVSIISLLQYFTGGFGFDKPIGHIATLKIPMVDYAKRSYLHLFGLGPNVLVRCVKGTFSHSHWLAQFYLFVLPISYINTKFRSKGYGIINIILFLLAFFTLLFTYSRTAIISLLASIFFIIFISSRNLTQKIFLMLGVVVLLIIVYLNWNRIIDYYYSGGDTLIWRMQGALVSLKIATANAFNFVFGIGFSDDILREYYQIYKLGIFGGHNSYALLLAKGGIIYILTFLSILFLVLKKSYLLIKKKHNKIDKAFFVIFLSFAIDQLGEHGLILFELNLIFFIVLGLYNLRIKKELG